MQVTAQQIAELLGGIIEGNPEVTISQPSKIEEGIPGSISFLGNHKYEAFAYTTKASALLVSKDFSPKKTIAATLIRVDDVYASITLLLEHFNKQQRAKASISKSCSIHDSVVLGEEVSVGHFTIINEGVKTGNNCSIAGQVFLGKGVQLGQNVRLYPGVKIYEGCVIGDHCIIHSNVVIGSDGFGFAPQEDGSYKKVPQVGIVEIGENVEIGANSVIDRATMGATRIHNGVKLDNLIQIAHNVEIGENTVIASQTGVAGSTKIGKSCQIGGQVGFAGHIKIADGTRIQAQSGIASTIKESNQALFGSPAFPYGQYVRSYTVFKQLPELRKKIFQLEKQLKKLNEKL